MFLTNFNEHEVMLALENNMLGKFAYLPNLVFDMEVTQNNLTIINSHRLADMFNIICNTKTSELEKLQQAADVFIKQQLPFAWWTGFNNEPTDLCHHLKKLNFHCTESELGMAVILSELPNKKVFQDLKIKLVDNDLLLNDFITVLTKLITNDSMAIRDFYESSSSFILDKNSVLKLFVGYLNDKSIATSALFCHNGVAGIWDIITLPKARRKGIGTDMTLVALNESKKLGYKIGVLTASDEGQHVYRKLGFEPLQQFYVYNLN